MGGGGGKAPEPKKFVSPPIDNSPATNPIPNFFGPRPGVSPYAVMAALQQAQRPQPFQQFGQQSPPTPFSAGPMVQRELPQQQPTPQPQQQQPVAPPMSGPMTKEEFLARRKLGKGGGV